MKEQYPFLLKTFSKNPQYEVKLNDLKEGHESWEKYKKHQCDLEQSVFGGSNSINWGECNSSLIQNRQKEIERIYNVYKIWMSTEKPNNANQTEAPDVVSTDFFLSARYEYILNQITRLNGDSQKAFFSFVILASLSAGAISAIYVDTHGIAMSAEERASALILLSVINTVVGILFITILFFNMINWYRYRCDEVRFLEAAGITGREYPKLKYFLLWTETWYCVTILLFIFASWLLALQ